MKTKNNVLGKALITVILIAMPIFFIFSQVSGATRKNKGDNNAVTTRTIPDNNPVVEGWMIDKDTFDSKNLTEPVAEVSLASDVRIMNEKLIASATAALAPALEAKMEIEDWMINESNFTVKNDEPVKKMGGRKIETWKVKEEKYGNRKFILTQVSEKRMDVERWMLNNKYW